MIKNVLNSWFAVFVITMTNIMHFVINMYMITNTVSCVASTISIFMTGLLFIPILFVITGVIKHDRTTFIFKLLFITIIIIIYPGCIAYILYKTYTYCPANNIGIWFFQGTSVPILIWTLYKLIKFENNKLN